MSEPRQYDASDMEAALQYEQDRAEIVDKILSPSYLCLNLCPPHASISGTIRPIESCPVCLRNHRDELINVLVGIIGVTGYHMEEYISFSPRGLVDLNKNLAIAQQLLGNIELADSVERRLRASITLAVSGLEHDYGSAARVLQAMRGDIDRRLAQESE